VGVKSEFARKFELLQFIPRFALEELAEKHGVKKSGSTEDLRKRLAEVVKYEVVEDVYEKFEDAGNVTIHLFKFDKGNVSRLRDESVLRGLLREYGMEDVFKSRKEFKVTETPRIVFIDYADKDKEKIKIKLEFRGPFVVRRDADTRKLIKFSPLLHGVVVIHVDSGLVEARIRSRKFATLICEKVSEYFNNGSYEFVDFSEEEVEEIIKWGKTLRNAILKPLGGGISSLRLTASKGSDLRHERAYREVDKLVGECMRTGIYIQFDYKYDEKVRTVGFQINTRYGKIFFKTYVSEEEIDYVLSKIKEIKGY